MNNINRHASNPLTLRIVAIGEWLMVLPATVLLAAAAARLLQPSQHEPARTAWMISEWAMTHIPISRLDAALLFIGMPGIVIALGCATLLRAWHNDAGLRQDAAAVVAIVRRQFVVGLLTGATLLAAAILFAVLAHILTD